jgi:hypothetical protein
MADTGTAQSVATGVSALGRRVSVGAGALVSLAALLADAPVWVASARGAGTAIAGLLVVRAASAALRAGARAKTDG